LITNTPTFTPTQTPTTTSTDTPVNTSTNSPTNTPVVANTATSTPTQTPTTTSTATMVNSPTNTITSTPTFIAIPTATPNFISNPYPNPSMGDPIKLDVQLSGQSHVKFGVFTPAFRKIWEGALTASSNQTLEWDLRDKTGTLVADGLYYLRIQVETSSGTFVKIKKVLVIR